MEFNNSKKDEAQRLFENFKTDKIKGSQIEKGFQLLKHLGPIGKEFGVLLEMLKDSFSGKFEIPVADLAIIGGALAYVISPLDAVPDIVPFLGWADDAFIVKFVLDKLQDLINRYKRFKNREIDY